MVMHFISTTSALVQKMSDKDIQIDNEMMACFFLVSVIFLFGTEYRYMYVVSIKLKFFYHQGLYLCNAMQNCEH